MLGGVTFHAASDFMGLSPDQWDVAAAVATTSGLGLATVAALLAVFQLRHSRRTHREQTRPYMVIWLAPGETSFMFSDLMLRNVGTTPAYDLRITFDPKLERAREEADYPIAKSRLFSETIPMWAPGYEFRQFFDSNIEREQERQRRAADPEAKPLIDRWEVTLSYAGEPTRKGWWHRKPRRHEDKQILDANLGAGAMYTEAFGVHHGAQALRDIAKHLKDAPALKAESLVVTEARAEWVARKQAELDANRERAKAWREQLERERIEQEGASE